ncbi:MAG: tetratricopeptide repeat protein [Synechococcales cyanobacterium C42_A2020_086]|nr:tetratricopeptide repeat protein [Synechococcales cyanobacterium C42_A2020_086]
MTTESCKRPNCNGTIDEGYCDTCGMAAVATLSGSLIDQIEQSSAPVSSSFSVSSRSRGSRRTRSVSQSNRNPLGAGLVSLPDLPSTEPEKLLLSDPKVPENKRFCSRCEGALRREQGFCSQCGQKYSFMPSLKAGDIVADQYEVKGAIAYGGLGWIYLGFDRLLSRYVVLKGLLNTEDEASAAVAVAERQFLATVKHPNIVGIYNFVNHGGEGFIIMEYVGGKTLKEIRKQRGPLPVAEAIAYIHRILNAFAYLHSQGLVYCDFKPDNVMVEGGDVKLIDMGGVRRLDDRDGDIYGTVGYSAPEVAAVGPSVASDLFTVGRTLAVLLTSIPGFSQEYQYTLPTPLAEPLFAQQESLYRFLLKATAYHPEDRFQSADEMAEQLLGVLRETVALETATPRPAVSHVFADDPLAFTASPDLAPITASPEHVPLPLLDTTDPAFNALIPVLAIPQPEQRNAKLKQVVEQFPESIEAMLQWAKSSMDLGHNTEAEQILRDIEAKDIWDWRVLWYRGRLDLAQGTPSTAQDNFDRVYTELPGELAPKLALAIAAEHAKQLTRAIELYDRISRTDSNYVSASFGLARCQFMQGNRSAAISALERVPPRSSLYLRARIEAARLLTDAQIAPPQVHDLQQAAAIIESLTLNGADRYRLVRQVFETALQLITSKVLTPDSSVHLLGQSLEEVKLRLGLEKALRNLAHLATGDEKIWLVDEANRVRPKTLF